MKKIMFNDQYGLTEAVLGGRKTQTRRIVPQSVIEKYSILEDPTIIDDARYEVGKVVAIAQNYKSIFECDCRRVKEGEMMFNLPIKNVCNQPGWNNKMFVRADLMPHRIRITNVEVERLQDISDKDCMAEGIIYDQYDLEYDCGDVFDYPGNGGDAFDTPREAYASLIDKISGKGTWESNPFVFVYDFELVK